MKKLFSFFTLLIFTLIVFSQNTMMSFAMQKMDMKVEMIVMENNKNSSLYCNESNSNEHCNHDCCYESAWLSNMPLSNIIRENSKKLKIKINNLVDIFTFSLKSFDNKNLVKITSPPNKARKIKNYSYIELIKIIKSNT